MLTIDEELRYSRHLILPGVGLQGQERLKRAHVALVGAGGLGAPAALYLAAAGVGTLTIIDADTVELTNLQRQIIHTTPGIGERKVDSAARALANLNPRTRVIPIATRLTAENAREYLAECDLIIDGTDNFPTRYLINDACVLLGKPWVFGSIYRFAGQVAVFAAKGGPCYRCLFPDPPPPDRVPSCAEGGVLGVLPGLVGVSQATEALKLLLGIGEPLIGRLLMLDALTLRFHEVAIDRAPDCPVCGDVPTITELATIPEYCSVVPTQQDTVPTITPEELQERLRRGACSLLDVRSAWEYEDIPGIPGARHIPDTDFARHLATLDSVEEYVLYCSTGVRSWQWAHFLHQAGFTRVWSLHGGLLAYRRAVKEFRIK